MIQQSLSFAAATTGFGLGVGAIFSIGPQNIKLIQAGALGRYPATVAATGYLSEIVLVMAGVCGIGAALQARPSIALAMQVAGIAFLLWTAAKALAPSTSFGRRNPARPTPETRRQATLSMLAMTWLNPLVYVEILLLVGLLSSSFGDAARLWFALGFLAASLVRFCGLPTFGRVLAPWLESARAQAAFDRVAGSLLVVVAVAQAAAIA